jgi:Skp family chaperone for outer membrane proteins
MVAEASDSLRRSLDELVKVEQRLTPREREAGKLNLRARELLVEQMLENLDGIIQQRLDELRGPLLLRIRDAVRVVRVREGYHLALDRATSGLEVDADDSIDITRAIVAELRRPLAERPPSAPPEAPGRSLRPRPDS